MLNEEAKIELLPNLKKPAIKNAAEVVDELRRLEEVNGGKLTPDVVVDAAAHPASPMHQYFEWDDSEAAREYRLSQARTLITSVRVRIESLPSRPMVRAFVHVQGPAANKSHYASAAKAMSDPDTRDVILARALQELQSFQKRYAEFMELAEVFSSIEAINARLAANAPAQRGAPIIRT